MALQGQRTAPSPTLTIIWKEKIKNRGWVPPVITSIIGAMPVKTQVNVMQISWAFFPVYTIKNMVFWTHRLEENGTYYPLNKQYKKQKWLFSINMFLGFFYEFDAFRHPFPSVFTSEVYMRVLFRREEMFTVFLLSYHYQKTKSTETKPPTLQWSEGRGLISCDAITNSSRWNSFEFIIESVHFIKAVHYVGFYELLIIFFSHFLVDAQLKTPLSR